MTDRQPWSYSRVEDEELEPSSLASQFRMHANKWERETAKLSSTRDIALHPSYQRIMAMGQPVLPLIFAAMRESPNHWFWALRFITGEDPVSPEDLGKIRRMTEVWLKWATQRGLIS